MTTLAEQTLRRSNAALRGVITKLKRGTKNFATGKLDHTWSARTSGTSRAYDAATENRNNADWRTGLTSSTLAIIEGLDVMLARSRWLLRNDGYAVSAQGGYRRRVVGGGITARALARDDAGKMLKDFNAAHDLLWNAWALDPAVCDVEKTKCLYEKQALWMDELFAAGGVLLRLVYSPRPDTIGLAVQEIEYEQFNQHLTSYGGNAVYRGVETDPYGAPLAYHVFAAGHPLEESGTLPIRLPAEECIHIFRKQRVRQRLGAPMMAAIIPSLRNLAMYEIYTLGKARTEAAYHGFIKEPPESTSTLDAIRRQVGGKVGDEEDDDAIRVRIENGLFPVLRGGREVTFPTPTTPNSVYAPYVQENLKKIGAGTGLDLATLARWYADGNFNTQRRAQLETEAEVEAIQDLQFINGALRKVREMFTDIAVLEKKIFAPEYFTSARKRASYLMTNWQGPPKRSVDVIKDQAAWDMMFRSLRGTPQEYCNERGKDVRDVFSEWQEVFEMADEYGLGELLRAFFLRATANAPKAGMQPDGTGGGANPADAQPGVNQGRLAPLLTDRFTLQEADGGNGKRR